MDTMTLTGGPSQKFRPPVSFPSQWGGGERDLFSARVFGARSLAQDQLLFSCIKAGGREEERGRGIEVFLQLQSARKFYANIFMVTCGRPETAPMGDSQIEIAFFPINFASQSLL